MSSPIFETLLDPIGALLGAISPALGDIWRTITKWTGAYYVGKWLSQNIVEPLIKWVFGLEDQDIYEVDVVACSMFQNNLYNETQLDLVTKYMKRESWDAKKYIMSFADTGEKQFGKFYRCGKWYYVDYLPELKITCTTIKAEDIKSIIEREKNDTIFINDILVTAPYDDDWCRWLLQENYNYKFYSDYIEYNGGIYKFNGSKYNSVNNNFDVTLTAIKTIRVRVYNGVSVTITPVSQLDVKKYRIEKAIRTKEEVKTTHTDTISIQTLYETIKIIKREIEIIQVTPTDNPKLELLNRTVTQTDEYYLADSNMLFGYQENTTVYTPYEVTAGTVQDSQTSQLLGEEIKDTYLKYIAVVRRSVKLIPNTEKVFYDKTSLIGQSIEPTDEPIEASTTEDIETETEIVDFIKTTVSEKTIYRDSSDKIVNTEEKIISVDYKEDDGGERNEYEYTDLLSHIAISDNEIETTVITEETTYSSVETGKLYYRKIDTKSETSVPIEAGTGHAYSTYDLIADYDMSTGTTGTVTLSLENHNNIRRYSVYYTSLVTNESYIWIYNPATTIYPSLNTPVEVINNIEAYPIVMLRNEYFDVVDYKLSSKNGRNRPSTVTEARYKSTKQLLNEIGIDLEEITKSYSKNGDIDKIQDAFYTVGISPNNKAEIVSKVLFEMFDFISDKMPFIEGEESGCSVGWKEMPFNAGFIWEPTGTTISKGVIGSLGTYKHTISGQNLILQKQITTTEVKTIRLNECRAFTIVNWSIAGGGKDFDLNDKNLVFPLAVEIVGRLSLVDRTALLGQSAYIVFYSFQHQHLEWYETAEFASAMQIIGYAIAIIIAIVVFIFTWWSGPTGAITAYMIMMAALKAIIISIALTLAMMLIMENVQDTNLKILLGVAATAVAIWAGGGFSAGQTIGQTAAQIAQLCATALQIYSQDWQQRLEKQFEKLQDEVMNFQKKYEKRSEELSNKWESMNSGLNAANMVDLIDMTSFETSRNASTDIVLMSPTQFFTAAIDGYRNYNMLYDGLYDSTVHKFHAQKLNLGVTQDTSEE